MPRWKVLVCQFKRKTFSHDTQLVVVLAKHINLKIGHYSMLLFAVYQHRKHNFSAAMEQASDTDNSQVQMNVVRYNIALSREHPSYNCKQTCKKQHRKPNRSPVWHTTPGRRRDAVLHTLFLRVYLQWFNLEELQFSICSANLAPFDQGCVCVCALGHRRERMGRTF